MARPAHRVRCSHCGNVAEVPFEPDPARPVYCADCYRQRSARRTGGARRPAARPGYETSPGFVEREQ